MKMINSEILETLTPANRSATIGSMEPLEFALLACDLLTDSGVLPDDGTQVEALAAEGGFLIELQLGPAMSLRLSYDEQEQQFCGSVRLNAEHTGEVQMRRALVLNAVMPAGRRFEMDADAGALALTEQWPAQGLAMEELAAGLELIVQSMHSLVCGLAPAASADSALGVYRA